VVTINVNNKQVSFESCMDWNNFLEIVGDAPPRALQITPLHPSNHPTIQPPNHPSTATDGIKNKYKNTSLAITYIGELDHTELSEIGQTVMSRVLINNQRNIFHGLRTEPARHGCVFLALS